MSANHLDLELAHRFVRGDLDSVSQHAIQQHLAACEACRALVAEERSITRILGLDRDPPSPTAGVDRALAAVAVTMPALARRRRWQQRGLYGLAAAACVLLAAALLRPLRTGERFVPGSDLGISSRLALQVLDDLEALKALRADPWIAHDLDAVLAFERLLEEGETP